ncbi:MAG: nuclear transport factor 2 family protein [Hyphomonadaceae bacterium]|nr:nuclear transport factor 2 family protein [Hyphomonadaceae bacterium]
MSFEDIEAIKCVKYSYCNGIDRCDLALLESIMTPDIKVDYVGGTYRFRANGRDEVLKIMKQAFNPKFVSCHTVHMPFIDLTSATTANGRWRLLDYAMNLAKANEVTVGAAEYQDTYQKGDDGNWRIRSSGYERIFERVFNEPDPALTHYFLGGGHVDKDSDLAKAKPFVG